MDKPLNGANGAEVHSPREEGYTLLKPLTYTTLILDLGDVLAYYSSKNLSLSVDPSQLKYILSCEEWFQHECGRLAREECFKRIEKSFGVTPENLQKTLLQLAATLTYYQDLIDLIRYLKNAADGDLKVYLATNITEDDWKILGPPVKSWGIFDAIFTSFELGVRKPEQEMYRRILKSTNTDPERAVFIDDKPENLATAQMLGIRGIHCDNPQNVIRQLKNLFGDPVARGHAWLQQNAKNMWSVSNTGIVIHEQFAQLLLLEITQDM
jgi:FMN phosphatase YigB (HAD superfamily)